MYDGTTLIQNPPDYYLGAATSTTRIKKLITIKNEGTTPTLVIEANLSSSNFYLTSNSCVRQSLKPGETCFVVVNFSGIRKNINSPYTTLLSVGGQQISIVSQVEPAAAPSPPQLVFMDGATDLTQDLSLGAYSNDVTLSKTLSVRNFGSLPTSALSLELLNNSSGFFTTSNACVNKILASGESCSFSLRISTIGKSAGLHSVLLKMGDTTQVVSFERIINTPAVITYHPEYAAYGDCSVSVACEGIGAQVRTFACRQHNDGIPGGYVNNSNCTSSNLSISCDSPAGNIVETIVSGTETYFCAAGSTTKQFISRVCNAPSIDNGVFCSIDLIYFGARSGGNGSPFNIHVSDGTAAGTISIKPQSEGGPQVQDSEFFSFNGKSFFIAGHPDSGSELWTSNSTTAGTFLIKDINPGTGDSSINSSSAFARLNSTQVLFTANDGTHGVELWVTDGTTAGTNMVKDIFPGITNSSLGKFAVLNNKAYFAAKSSTAEGTELWVTDGTEAGTSLLKDINTSLNGNSNPNNLVVFNNKVFFVATTTTAGTELWSTDGTTLGTALFKDITGNVNPSTPTELTVVGNQLFFAAQDTPTNGIELWKSDGTAIGTVMVKNLRATGSSGPGGLTAANGKLYFYANDGTSGLEPFVSDGTSAGTYLLKDIFTGVGTGFPFVGVPNNSLPMGFTEYNGLVYFRAVNPASVYEIYVTDGTPEGTSLFHKLNPSPIGTSITQPKFIKLNNLLYFTGNNGSTGSEVFYTDGTPAGTQLLTDINGTGTSSIIGELYFIQLTPL